MIWGREGGCSVEGGWGGWRGVKTGAVFPPPPASLGEPDTVCPVQREGLLRVPPPWSIWDWRETHAHAHTHTETICSVNAAPALKTEVGGKERGKRIIYIFIYINPPKSKQGAFPGKEPPALLGQRGSEGRMPREGLQRYLPYAPGTAGGGLEGKPHRLSPPIGPWEGGQSRRAGTPCEQRG